MIYLIILFLSVSSFAYAAAPTRAYTYVSNTPIDPSQNNTNENALYSYLQTGVDTYASGSITGDAISATAAIAYSKLALTNSIVNADISPSAAIADSKLAQITTAGKVSGAALTSLSSTPAGAGAFPAANITDFTLSGQGQGAIAYKGASNWAALDAGSTAGLVLKTNTSISAPSWVNSLGAVADYGTSTSSSTARQGTALKVAYGQVSIGASSSTTITNLAFSSSTSFSFVITQVGTGPGSVGENPRISISSGSSVTIFNDYSGATLTYTWMAMGT